MFNHTKSKSVVNKLLEKSDIFFCDQAPETVTSWYLLPQIRVGPRLRRLQERVPEEAVVRSHVHAAGPVVGAVPARVEGEPEAVQHGAGVRDARRGDDGRGRGVVDPVPLGGRGPVGRPWRGRVSRVDGGPGQRPAQRVRLRV